VLGDDSRVYAFGSNAHGQLGQGDATERNKPALIKPLCGKQIADIVCGFHHLIALSMDNATPAVDPGSMLPETGIWYTDGVTLCAHFPDARDTCAMVSRSFALDTGAHLHDGRSCLPARGGVGMHAIAYDRARDVMFAHTAAGTEGCVCVYANVGPQRACFLAPGARMDRFPAIAEAVLSMPEMTTESRTASRDPSGMVERPLAGVQVQGRANNTTDAALAGGAAVSGSLLRNRHGSGNQEAALAQDSSASRHAAVPASAYSGPAALQLDGCCGQMEAETCAIVVLAHLDMASRKHLMHGKGDVWQPWCGDARPETFRMIGELLAHCRCVCVCVCVY
jgi:hypothetical protein